MMRFADIVPSLQALMPHLRGTMTANAPLVSFSWFRTGGPAQVLFAPEDEADLALFLSCLPEDIKVCVIGLGSNLLVRDGGVEGVVIQLGRGFQETELLGNHRLRVGAGAVDVKVARLAADHSIDGLSFLRGIPGTIGGALRMNGGAYGGDIAQVFESARAIDRQGRLHQVTPAIMDFGYRHSHAPQDWIFTEAVLRGFAGRKDDILARMNEISSERAATQPVNTRTGGSTFKNPEGAKAWELVDQAGCRGLRCGGAQVSTLHCNFLVADAGATATDIEALGEAVRQRVLERTGITLEWEIRRIGMADPRVTQSGLVG